MASACGLGEEVDGCSSRRIIERELPQQPIPSQVQLSKAARAVPHMGVNYVRGNMMCSLEVFTPISVADADALPMCNRRQRKGLCYHPAYPGFNPRAWPVVIEAREDARLELGAQEKDESPSVVDICRSPTETVAPLLEVTNFVVGAHNPVRPDDGVGTMAGAGKHLYHGRLKKFALKDKQQHGRLGQTLQMAGKAFNSHFAERDVGYKEMLALQANLLPPGTPAFPQCWNCSDGLGNSMHIDHDAARSFAVWLCLKPGASREWWFLFPRHGVAIALTHGTYISWDGRVAEHCSAVPDVVDGDRLLSLFASLPAILCNVLEREQKCVAMLAARNEKGACSGSMESVVEKLQIGMLVTVRHVPEAPEHMKCIREKRKWGQREFRWVRCKVTAIHRCMSARAEHYC